ASHHPRQCPGAGGWRHLLHGEGAGASRHHRAGLPLGHFPVCASLAARCHRQHDSRWIAEVVESRASAWGIHVDSIRLLDINMPEDLKRMMSRQASAEREKRATITKAEGDRDAAVNLAQAADTMSRSVGAMQLRTLQTLDGLGSSVANT